MKRRYFLRHPPDCSGAKKSIKQGDYWLNRVVGIQQGGRNPTGGVRGAGRSYNDDVIQVNKHRQTLSTGAGRFFTFQIDKHFSRNFFSRNFDSRNFGEKNEQGGFHFTFRSKFWAGWAAPGRQQNLGGTAAPENEMVAVNPYNTWRMPGFTIKTFCLERERTFPGGRNSKI